MTLLERGLHLGTSSSILKSTVYLGLVYEIAQYLIIGNKFFKIFIYLFLAMLVCAGFPVVTTNGATR